MSDLALPPHDTADSDKRRFLTLATGAVGAVAIVGAASPFVASFFPSERAKAAGAPTDIDISKLEAGQKVDHEWRGKPVWVVKRTPEMLQSLTKIEGDLLDPQSESDQQPKDCTNQWRSIKPEILVSLGVCTHLGCTPTYRPDLAPADLGPSWVGGFYCPCHGSKFDLAGRVYKGVPAPQNLEIPVHSYITDTHIRVGEEA